MDHESGKRIARVSSIKRKTYETDIELEINIDGTGENSIQTNIGFFDHMLSTLSKHSSVDMKLKCIGDLEVDYHHSVEDVGIVIGEALLKALGDKVGIKRFSNAILPMDDALVLCAIDISGRSYFSYDVEFDSKMIGKFNTELVEVFFNSLAMNLKANLHFKKISGFNSHHIAEACFKSFAICLKDAVTLTNSGSIPSVKGCI
ncbi:Imidazoleglycerol-phosphate dehydratase [Thermodesulfobium narugense DSM 14796]|uniref:Imidazoleglycerol-phosphate dehydratase n=1 Tax=Thermodesulfobium narugense DSM 14796 TaxID=747365 RepID=M1E832_9BACT|nr:imidazoleglycerol-phosphate dehydratase HisB [Thermodesulfobium narugense]AEE14254.1 Imidazoleglycerol-phosphate dehydratase [Thermodesulfobium narugense DSM 14796]